MLFGLTNALAIFMDFMNKIFHDFQDKFVVVFIDDILIYSKNEEEHDEHLRITLETLRKNQSYAKFSNCGFRLERVAFLGTYVSKECVFIDPAKIHAVSEWPTPKNVLDISLSSSPEFRPSPLFLLPLPDFLLSLLDHRYRHPVVTAASRSSSWQLSLSSSSSLVNFFLKLYLMQNLYF